MACDLDEATVEYISEDRKETRLGAYFEVFPRENRESIEAICLDMWPAYINACRANVPGAEDKIVFDIVIVTLKRYISYRRLSITVVRLLGRDLDNPGEATANLIP